MSHSAATALHKSPDPTQPVSIWHLGCNVGAVIIGIGLGGYIILIIMIRSSQSVFRIMN